MQIKSVERFFFCHNQEIRNMQDDECIKCIDFNIRSMYKRIGDNLCDQQ